MRVAALSDIDLLSSNITEALHSEWLVGTPYVATNKVYVTLDSTATTEVTPHRIYEAIGATTGDYPPDNPSEWSDSGATNRWKMFDGSITSQSANASSIEVEIDSSDSDVVGIFNIVSDNIELTQIVNTELLTDGDCSTDSFIKGTGWTYDGGNLEYDCSGSQTADSKLYQTLVNDSFWYQIRFTIKNYSAGNIAGLAGGVSGTNVNANGTYTQIIEAGVSTDFGLIADSDFVGSVDDISSKFVPKYENINLGTISAPDYWEYFFSPFESLEDIIWYFPVYGSSTIRIRLAEGSGLTECGLVVVGESSDVGLSQFNPTIGILDYSIKSTDSFGNTILSQGNYAKRVDLETDIQNNNVDSVQKKLSSLRGIPALYDCNNTNTEFESLIVYGFYERFDILIPNITFSVCNIRIQGLV